MVNWWSWRACLQAYSKLTQGIIIKYKWYQFRFMTALVNHKEWRRRKGVERSLWWTFSPLSLFLFHEAKGMQKRQNLFTRFVCIREGGGGAKRRRKKWFYGISFDSFIFSSLLSTRKLHKREKKRKRKKWRDSLVSLECKVKWNLYIKEIPFFKFTFLDPPSSFFSLLFLLITL